MKQTIGVMAGILLLLNAQVVAQQSSAQAAANKPKTSVQVIKGIVKSDAGKVKLVTEVDQKSWVVANPEALSSYAGQVVEVEASVYTAKGKIKVIRVIDRTSEAKKPPKDEGCVTLSGNVQLSGNVSIRCDDKDKD